MLRKDHVIEVRDSVGVSDERKAFSKVRIYPFNGLLNLPTREEMMDICSWHADPA